MNRKVYCPCDSNFKPYFKSQLGSGFSDITVFRGVPYQRGYGLGSLFRRFGIPIVKFLGKHVLKTGMNIGQDILEKKNVKETLKTRAKEGLKQAAQDSLAKASAYVEQKGKGLKRKNPSTKSTKHSYKKSEKRIKKDIFD